VRYKRYIGELNIGVYNAYGRRNPYEINAFFNENNKKIDVEVLSLLPFVVPSISYKISLL